MKTEVVTCKDCIHRLDLYYENKNDDMLPNVRSICGHIYGLNANHAVCDWDYCSKGEKVKREENK